MARAEPSAGPVRPRATYCSKLVQRFATYSVISMPKRQLIAAGFSQTMAMLLEELKATPFPTPLQCSASVASRSMAGS